MTTTRAMFAATMLMLFNMQVFAQGATVITGRVTTREDNLSVPGATVSIPSLDLSTVTDADGRYMISVPAGLARGQLVDLRVTFGGLQPEATQIRLNPGTQTLDFALRLAFAEEITVGSRAPGAEAELAVPVDILTSEQIQATGVAETMQVIQMLAPSFNFPRPTIADGTDSVRPATLRGLGPDQVLVLVNGKRRHQTALIHVNSTIGRGSAGVDLNAIPVSAIERIEILRDGAAAQYGSDAIAGVINIVLKSRISRPTVSLRAGGNVGSFTDVFATDHDFTDGGTTDASGSWGISLGPRGSLTLAAEFRDRRGTNRAGPDTGDAFSPQPNIHWGDSEEQNGLVFANAELPLDEAQSTFLYAFGGWTRRTGSHGGNYRRRIDAGNLPQLYPNGFLPLIEPINVDASVAGGVRGIRQGWFWDLSGVFGHNRLDYYVGNSLNVSLGPAIPPNQTEFYSGAIAFNEVTLNADARRQVDLGLASAANLAFGFEYRRDNYQIFAGEPASYIDGGASDQFGNPAIPGAQVFPGFRPLNETDASRNSVAAYADLEGDVSTMLRVGTAGRWERFDDFGNTGDGKLTVRLQPHRRFVARGAVSSGFRAPSLGQIHFSTVSTNFSLIGGQFVPVEAGTYPVGSPQARVLGATDLTPEQSIHYSAGVVVNPVDLLDITFDYYRITIDERIVLSDNFTGARITDLLRPFGANGARYFTNAIDTKTQGVDVIANYAATLRDNSTLRLQAAYNRTETDITRISPTPPQLIGFENTLFSRIPPNDIEYRRFTCAQPDDNVRLTADWQKGVFGTVVRSARFGKYCSIEAVDQIYSAEWVVDLDLTYRIQSALLGFGIQNIANALPDQNLVAVSNRGGRTFPRNAPFGFNGRYVYGRISYTF